MQTDEAEIDLRSYLTLLYRRRWILVATLFTVVTATVLVTWRLTPVYTGVALVEIQPTGTSSTEASRAIEALVDPTRGLQTQVSLAQSQETLNRAAQDLKLSSTDGLEDALSVDLQPDTQILEIRVEHERPDEARAWANAIAAAYLAFRRESVLENSSGQREQINKDIQESQQRIADIDARVLGNPVTEAQLRSERDRELIRLTALQNRLDDLPDPESAHLSGGRIITSAEVPTEPTRPNKLLNVALSVVVGTLLGLGLVLVAENLDDRLKNPDEVESRVGAPVLGYIPFVKEWSESQRSKVAVLSATASGAAEAYRTLKTNLRFVSLEKPLRTILVTSPVAGAGKSTTAANLASALAQDGSKVVLVSADLRRPSVHKIFGLSNSKGLVNVLDPSFPLIEALQEPGIPNLRLLATGGLPPNPTEILSSPRFAQVVSELEKVSDYVILDAPPVLGLGDSSALASKVDGILLVVRTGGVTKRELSHAVDQLRKAGGNIGGVVLNAVEAEEGYGYYYHYYYTQYHEETNGKPLIGDGLDNRLESPAGAPVHLAEGGKNSDMTAASGSSGELAERDQD
jgi:capsular exopolysaccharide synthesis family protein